MESVDFDSEKVWVEQLVEAPVKCEGKDCAHTGWDNVWAVVDVEFKLGVFAHNLPMPADVESQESE